MKQINMSLNSKSINKAIKELDAYQNELMKKCKTVVERLAEVGIETAVNSTLNFGSFITFTQKIESQERDRITAVMLAYDSHKVKRQWLRYGEVVEAEISPLLMEEFGSGFEALNPMNVPGVGQGTFPGQTHAYDEGGWWYMDLNGEWHKSTGEKPGMPMYAARVRMSLSIDRILREVFNGR